MRRISFLFAALLGLGALLRAAPAGAMLVADQPYRFDPTGRLVTDVYVNGQGPLSFLIDTASSRSLIFEHVRARLGLTASAPELLTVYGINDTGTAVPVQPRELRIASAVITGLTIGVLPDPANPADEPDGVLGIDALARYFVVLDRATMHFKLLTPGPEAARDYSDWAEVPLSPHPLKNIPLDFWYLRARFNGANLMTLLDLGAGVTMLNWQAAELLGVKKHDFSKRDVPEDLRDVLGSDAPAVRLMEMGVSMPGIAWTRQNALVSGAPVFGWFNLDEKPAAIVGPGLLGNNSLAIDFAGRRLFVGPTHPERAARAEPWREGQ